MSQTTAAAPQVSGRMFLFERPELLNREQHGHLGMRRIDKPFAFCAKARAIPLTFSEILTASKHYPIVFTGDKDIVPVAVVGVIEDINLYVDDQGMWEQDAYIPGYIRRYPFALATETGGERVAMVIDMAFPGVTPQGEVALFDKGEPSEQTRSAIEFCRQYEGDRRTTETLMKQLEAYQLIVGQTAQYTAPGATEAQPFAQYFGVDEQRLNNLHDEKFIELRRSGILPILYGQLMSLGNWRHLLSRRARRFNLTGDAILKPLNRS